MLSQADVDHGVTTSSELAPLAVRGATLKFGGVTALDDVSITVNDDELLAIIGPNGAGKTSLLNVTAGFYRPQKGHVELSGKNVTGLRVDQIARRGLARTFQGTHLFAGQTVVENIMIGRHMLMNVAMVALALVVPSNNLIRRFYDHTRRGQFPKLFAKFDS